MPQASMFLDQGNRVLPRPDSPEHSGDISIESLLFVADGPVTVERLWRALQSDERSIEESLARLTETYRARGVRILRNRDTVMLVSAPESAECVERFLGLAESSRLSVAAMETLAIVAYRQPVTRTQIESIRGVNADYAIRALLARSLIQENGRLDTIGRPAIFGTTPEFLQYFGISDLSLLPPLPGDLRALADRRATVEEPSGQNPLN